MGARWPEEAPKDFPRHVKIARRLFSVEYLSGDHEDVREEQLLGFCEQSEDRIGVSLAQTVHSMRNVVIHEIAHAAYHHHAIGGAEADDDEEEKIVAWATDLILALEESGILKLNF